MLAGCGPQNGEPPGPSGEVQLHLEAVSPVVGFQALCDRTPFETAWQC